MPLFFVRQYPDPYSWRLDPDAHEFRVTFVKADSARDAEEYCLANFEGAIKEVMSLPAEASVERFVDLSSNRRGEDQSNQQTMSQSDAVSASRRESMWGRALRWLLYR